MSISERKQKVGKQLGKKNDKSLQDVIDDGGEIYRCPTVLAMSGGICIYMCTDIELIIQKL